MAGKRKVGGSSARRVVENEDSDGDFEVQEVGARRRVGAAAEVEVVVIDD